MYGEDIPLLDLTVPDLYPSDQSLWKRMESGKADRRGIAETVVRLFLREMQNRGI